MSDNLLTEEDYNQIFKRRFTNPNIKCITSTLKSLTDCEGLCGDYYQMEMTYELNGETKVEYFFIKTKPVTKCNKQQDAANETTFFLTETVLYDTIFSEFDKYGIDMTFAPKCYYMKDETLVLEDLKRKGFYIPDSRNFFTLDQCKCGLKALALYHAAGLLFEQMKTKELGRPFCLKDEYPEVLEENFFTFFTKKRNIYAEEWCNDFVDLCLDLIDSLPERKEYKVEFKECLRKKPVGKIFVEETNITKFLGHGDVWAHNLLMKSENGVPKHCCLIDFQMARYFYASYDVLLFLLSNTNTKFYKKYLEELLHFYYNSLSDALAKHNYSINDFYSMEDFRRSLEIVEFEAKLQAYSIQAFTRIPEKILHEYKQNMNDNDFMEYKLKNKVFFQKDIFQRDDGYRNMLITDLYELRASLFKN